jgi:hypothetical protein
MIMHREAKWIPPLDDSSRAAVAAAVPHPPPDIVRTAPHGSAEWHRIDQKGEVVTAALDIASGPRSLEAERGASRDRMANVESSVSGIRQAGKVTEWNE